VFNNLYCTRYVNAAQRDTDGSGGSGRFLCVHSRVRPNIMVHKWRHPHIAGYPQTHFTSSEILLAFGEARLYTPNWVTESVIVIFESSFHEFRGITRLRFGGVTRKSLSGSYGLARSAQTAVETSVYRQSVGLSMFHKAGPGVNGWRFGGACPWIQHFQNASLR
jgi:hypothetical protein